MSLDTSISGIKPTCVYKIRVKICPQGLCSGLAGLGELKTDNSFIWLNLTSVLDKLNKCKS